ncbi:cytochrome P450 monooxygenase [Colletotrichum tofieldiae]|uniref:Cytochrome P450 monooxygenase n=1 Tax=Colletotrichum tofieldiae TaxID=708197 RepID=A0A166PC38_9PEZI|nr:cytochrome P450 monooxygenase [Colletotrichum tofieldiae]
MDLSPTEISQFCTSLTWIASIIAVLVFWRVRYRSHLAQFPLATRTSFWGAGSAKESFTLKACAVIEHGFRQFGASKPFRVVSEFGEMLILPPSLANDIRNDEKLSFAEYMKESMCASVPGFEPFHEATKSTLLSDMVKTKLTPALKWREVILKDSILDLIARLSARVFLGDEEVTRNASWLRITKEYTVNSFLATHEIRKYPPFLRSIIHWFLPRAQLVRAQLRIAESIIAPVIARRRAEKTSPTIANHVKKERSDSIEWLEQLSQARKLNYSAAALQLNLAISAIHTTTDLLTQVMYELMMNPEYIQPLRDEILDVAPDGELKHSSLYTLELMDSVIKEAQRLKPPMSEKVNMNRVATAETGLSDGTVIPKGTKLGVSSRALWDPNMYPNPDTFDGRRFLRLRQQPGNENAWQLTTTRMEHIAFGHGKHACPGRFLAANEIKIALCYMLLNYDWKLSPSTAIPKTIAHGIMLDSDPTIKVMVRRR